MPSTSVGWANSLAAVASMAGRMPRLMRSIPDPTVPALGVWNAGQVALHMAHVFEVDLALLRGEPSPLGDLDGLGEWTQAMVREEGVVDVPAVAERVERAAAAFLTVAASRDGGEMADWLGGTKMPVSAIACHIVSESMLHGLDMATATAARWRIEREDASLAFLGFICPMLAALGRPTYAVDPEAAAGVRACFDLRLRGGGRVLFVFHDGTLSIEPPSDRRVDCHLWIDPRALMLLAWGRAGLVPTIAKGQVVPWGRRPWLAPRLPGLVKNP